jgi:hypothetical protein
MSLLRRQLPAVAIAVLLLLGTGTRGEPQDPVAALRAELAALVAAGDYVAALKKADAVLAFDSRSVAAWQYRAYALHQLGRSGEAVKAYERTVTLDPENWWAHMNRGSLLATLGRWPEAIRAAGRAVALQPRMRVTQARLSRIHRDRGDYASARTAVLKALAAGTDPAWCHAELGYVTWVLEDLRASRAHWVRARSLGADAEDYAHGLRLIDWAGRTPRDPEMREEEHRRRHGPGLAWVFRLGRIEVHTRVGPKLPRDLERLFAGLERDDARFLGVQGEWPFKVRLFLSRTVEEHEYHRRREFPGGYPGKAFHVDRRVPTGGFRGGRRWERGMGGTLDMYVAWPVTGLKKSLSHELAHAVMRIRMPRATDVPAWLDEGIATYLELSCDMRGRPKSRQVRHDLLAAVRETRVAGKLLSWSEMIQAPRTLFQVNGARARYAQAWSMIHYLVEESGGEHRLRKYLGIVAEESGSRLNDFLRAYGTDLEKVEAAWLRHLEDVSGK